MRPMALSRLVSSKSSSTIPRSAPRSPRNFSSVRGQAPVAVGEVRAEGLLEGLGRLLVHRFRLADELLELRANDVHVDRHAGVLEGEQADPDGPLGEVDAIRHRALGHEGGQGWVADDQAIDDDAVALDPDASRLGGLDVRVDHGERWVRGGFHARTIAGPRDS